VADALEFYTPELTRWLKNRLGLVPMEAANLMPNTSLGYVASSLNSSQFASVMNGLHTNSELYSLLSTRAIEYSPSLAERLTLLNQDDRNYLNTLPGGMEGVQRSAAALESFDAQALNIPAEVMDAAAKGDANAQRTLRIYQTLFPGKHLHGVKAGIAGGFGEIANPVLNAPLRGVDVLTSPLAYAASLVPYFASHDPNKGGLPKPLEVFKRVTQQDTPGTGFGHAIADALGGREAFTPDQYDSVVTATSLIADWYLDPTVIAGKVMRGVKLATEGFQDLGGLAKGIREASARLEELRVPGGDLKEAARVERRLAELQGEYSNLVDLSSHSAITRSVFENVALQVSPETIMASARGRRITAALSEAISSGRVTSATELGRQWNSMPAALREALVLTKGASPSEVAEVMLAYGRGEGARSLKALRESKSSIEDALRIARDGEDWGAVNQLDLQRRLVDAKLSARLTPTFEPLEQLPKSSLLYRVANQAASSPAEQFLAGLVHGHLSAPIWSKNATLERITTLEQRSQSLQEQINLARAGLPVRGIAAGQEALSGVGRLGSLTKELDDVTTELVKLDGQVGKRTLQWVKTSPSLSRFFDKLPDRRWYVWTSPTEAHPPDAMGRTLKNMESFMKLADVTPAKRNAVLDAFTAAKDDGDWFKAMERMGDALAESESIALVRKRLGGKVAISAMERQAVNTFFDSIEDMRKYGVIPVKDVRPSGRYELTDEHVLPGIGVDGRTIGLPAGPEEFISHFPAPDIESLLEARSYTGRVLRAMETQGGTRQIAAAYKGLKRANRFAVSAWKDFLILPRTFIGSFQIRVIGEENIRLAAADKVSILSPREFMRYAVELPDQPRWLTGDFVGQIRNDLERELRNRPVKLKYYGLNPRGTNDLPEPGFMEALSARHGQIHINPVIRRLAASGGDVEQVTQWLLSEEGNFMRRTLGSVVARHQEWLSEQGLASGLEDAFRSYVERRWREVESITNGNPRILRAIASGKVRAGAEEELVAARSELDRQYAALRERYFQTVDPQTGAEMRTIRAKIAELDAQQGPKVDIEIGSREYADWLEEQRVGKELDTRDMIVTGYSKDPRVQRVKPTIRERLYARLSRHDMKYARRPLLNQLFIREKARLQSLGWDAKNAEARAWAYAAKNTADFMYDLAQRTSAQRFFRTIAPFAPAWQEVLETYTWKLPSLYYPGLGHLMMARRADMIVKALDEIGFDSSKLQKVPGAGRLLTLAMGLPVATNLAYDPKNLNFVTSTGFLPGLGPVSGAGMALLAKKTNIEAIDAMGQWLLPYGPDIQLGPVSFNALYEAFTGDVSPLEVASKDVQETQWQYSVDTATAQTFMQMADEAPKVTDYVPNGDVGKATPAERAAFQAATAKWMDELESRSNMRARVWAGVRGIASLAWPAAIRITDDAYEAQRNIYAQLLKLAGLPEGIQIDPKSDLAELVDKVRSSPEGQKLYDDFLDRFPNADLYLAPRKIRTAPIPGQAKEDRFYNRAVNSNGENLSQDDFISLGMYLRSYRFHQGRIDDIVGEAAKDQPGAAGAVNVLNNWGDYQKRADAESASWDAYGEFNADGRRLFEKLLQKGATDPDRPQFTIEQEWMLEILRDLDHVLPLLEEGGQKPEGYSDIRRSILDALEAGKAQFGEPKNPVLKFVGQWFEKVANPYFDARSALFKEADALPRSERGPIFDKLKELADQQKATRIGGTLFPTVEQWQWTASADKDELRAKWASRPIEWLTEFQRDKVGSGGGQRASEFFGLVTKAQRGLHDYGVKYGFSSSEYIHAKERVGEALNQRARNMGLSDLWNLSQAPPIDRLAQSGIAWSANFLKLQKVVDTLRPYVEAQDLSWHGTSELMRTVRAGIVSWIENTRNTDSAFRNDLDLLEHALAPAGFDLRPGTDLYNALVFDDWG
jgi:hypothetical protein